MSSFYSYCQNLNQWSDQQLKEKCIDLAIDYVNNFDFFNDFRVDRSMRDETIIYTLEDTIVSIDPQDPMSAWYGGEKGDRFVRVIFYPNQRSDKYVTGFVATVYIWVKDSTIIKSHRGDNLARTNNTYTLPKRLPIKVVK